MFFHPVQGIIALDIDGTVTAEAEHIPPDVIQFLHSLYQKGWQVIFITGRPFQWGMRSLQRLPFPYAVAVQNGALLVEMPAEKILARKYLSHADISNMEVICSQHHTDFVVYGGYENQDHCYYRPKKFPSNVLEYVQKRTAQLGEKWQPMQTFEHLPTSSFASFKCFAKERAAFLLSEQIEQELALHAPLIRDPFSTDYFVVQVTHPDATKGAALQEYVKLKGIKTPVIAAGDDLNDYSLLKAATIKIAMSNAPQKLLSIADIVAPPASEQGIIEGLTKALTHLSQNKGGSHG